MSDNFSGKRAEQYSRWGEKLWWLVYSRPFNEIIKLGEFNRILDAGCGPGILTCRLAQKMRNAKITGVDVSDDMIALARNRARRMELENVDFVCHDLVKPFYDTEGFNLVYSTYVMHHLDNPSGVLKNLWQLLVAGGILFVYDLRRNFFVPHGSRWEDVPGWFEEAALDGVSQFQVKKFFPAGLVLRIKKEQR